MSYRTVIITKQCKLSYKNNYLTIRDECVRTIHLSEIGIILIDSTQVSISTYLLAELVKNKIKVIFCDEQRNPISEIVPYYGSHNTSKKVMIQIQWTYVIKQAVWTKVVYQKIKNQANLLFKLGFDEYLKLNEYIEELQLGDVTNREGHSAKVYFNALFGKEFSRDNESNINAALNYGYSILLSSFNKEIVKNGYLTQLGLCHKNEFNFFNLSCDLMEPFRILVDNKVYDKKSEVFDKNFKWELVNLLNGKVVIEGINYYLTNAIQIYTKSVMDALEQQNIECLKHYEF